MYIFLNTKVLKYTIFQAFCQEQNRLFFLGLEKKGANLAIRPPFFALSKMHLLGGIPELFKERRLKLSFSLSQIIPKHLILTTPYWLVQELEIPDASGKPYHCNLYRRDS
jgi:hypothetical protein